jgi:TolB-like protein
VVHQHLSVEPRSVSDLRPAVPAGIARALGRSLAKTPADRFETAARFAEALAHAGSAAMVAAAFPPPAPPTRRARRLALLASAAVVVVAVALRVLRLGPQAPVPAGPVHERAAIAVLPFQNLSAEGAQAYFAGGLHDELLTQLAKVAALKVISRTSVMGYQGTTKPLKQIADELGVGSVVEGSVQVVGGRLRVNVQLIDAATDEHLWAERYDRTLDDAFAIQSEVAQRIVAAVGATLTSAEQGRVSEAPTANAEAYRLYLQGREYWTREVRFWSSYARSLICTGLARSVSSAMMPPPASTCPNVSTPVGQAWTHAEQRTHSGSCIGLPRLAKLMTSMPWWQIEVQALHEMHFFLSDTIAKRLKRA